MTLANKIVVIDCGNIEQMGSPMESSHNPINGFVAGGLSGRRNVNFPAPHRVKRGSRAS